VESADGPELHLAADASRDQSYFLFRTTREQLAFLRFPLGAMEKSEVRAIAVELGLGVADKPDSQDICFVPNGNYASVVSRIQPAAAVPGDIVDRDGNVLGRHAGVIHFTVGQRKGLGLSGNGEPLFVIRIDSKQNRVVVGPREALRTTTVAVKDVNWLAPRTEALDCAVKVRSTRPPVEATVFPQADGGALVEILAGEEAVAPGQACVFYERNGTRVLGGGWIARPENARTAA
jgi:tRNA-specific 2-thiouridylase